MWTPKEERSVQNVWEKRHLFFAKGLQRRTCALVDAPTKQGQVLDFCPPGRKIERAQKALGRHRPRPAPRADRRPTTRHHARNAAEPGTDTTQCGQTGLALASLSAARPDTGPATRIRLTEVNDERIFPAAEELVPSEPRLWVDEATADSAALFRVYKRFVRLDDWRRCWM